MKTTLSDLRPIYRKAAQGQFISFDYYKDGVIETRTVRVGGDIGKRLERQGCPINGKGNWISASKSQGHNGVIVKKDDGRYYLRGTDLTPGRVPQHKIFKLSNISNLR